MTARYVISRSGYQLDRLVVFVSKKLKRNSTFASRVHYYLCAGMNNSFFFSHLAAENRVSTCCQHLFVVVVLSLPFEQWTTNRAQHTLISCLVIITEWMNKKEERQANPRLIFGYRESANNSRFFFFLFRLRPNKFNSAILYCVNALCVAVLNSCSA